MTTTTYRARLVSPLLLGASLALVGGCSAIVDGAIQDRDSGPSFDAAGTDARSESEAGGQDVGPGNDAVVPVDAYSEPVDAGPPPCREGADGGLSEDGMRCSLFGSTEPAICLGGRCMISRCGDGVIDGRLDINGAPLEDCDDGNDATGDGCEPNCHYSCTVPADCFDGNSCTDDACDTTTHVCQRTFPSATRMCGMGSTGMCRMGSCVPAGCGNGTIEGTEQCDDGNMTDDDGCTQECRYTCDEDADCSDNDACTGAETCTLATHTCTNPANIDCNDSNDCTVDSCNPVDGACIHDTSTTDVDRDGHARVGSCTGADDCDDSNAEVSPSVAEICGNSVDDDCNASTSDDTRTTYYPDCDGDGFAASTASPQLACRASELGAPPCSGTGRWITRAPAGQTTTDCNDRNGAVFPGQTNYFTGADNRGSFDYDCSTAVEQQYGYSGNGANASCSIFVALGGVVIGPRLCFARTVYDWPTDGGANPPPCGARVTTYSCGGSSCTRSATPNQFVACH